VVREIKVLDKNLEVKSDGKLKADKNNPFHLGSSIPGTVSKVLVKEGEEVKKNQPLLTVEAMKMETSIVANQDGVIDKIYVKEAEKVNQGDLLVSFVQEG
ncbi:MAG: biotin/lipoyl-binding protein, partial [Anaerotignum sp.]|nr:biotin/lipoyl-binding protein [Anaerotignum sp.]